MSETYIIVGAGHAGGQAAATLRQKKFDGRILLIGDESYVPYERPPLSKAMLSGEMEVERSFLKKPDWYKDKDIEFIGDTRVTAINRAEKTVTTDSGDTLAYDKLLLTTGARVRKLNLPGAELENIFYLRTIDDTTRIAEKLSPGKKLVVVGGGYIGLEVAAVAVKLGAEVTVLEGLERVMNRVVAPVVSDFYEKKHSDAGVDIRCNVQVTAFDGDSAVKRVMTADGGAVEADLVVVGVGILPNVELAEAAGLACDNGIVVDEYGRTEDESIFAAGDVTNHPNSILDQRLRLESVQNAVDQAKTAATAMCGELKPYEAVPWFWSDQFDLKLQIVGLSDPEDEVIVRGEPSGDGFSVCYLRDGALAAVDCINAMKDFMAAKKLVAAGASPDPGRLADPSIPLKEV